MKKIYNNALLALLFVVTLVSCEDNEKSPFPITSDGSFVSMTFDNLILDVTDIDNTAVIGTLRAPVANVASYSLQVAWTGLSGNTTDYSEIYTTSSFPADVNVTLADIADAVGVEVSDFNAGDRFDFSGSSISTDGITTTFSSLNGDLQAESGQLQSYQYTSFISCPLDVSLIEGTYTVVALGFNGFFGEPDIPTGTRTVVAGPESNQFTIVEGEYPATGMSDPLIITVDPATGIVSGGGTDENGDPAVSFAEGVNGLPENTYLVEGGFFFSCIGFIDLDMNFNPFSGNAHSFTLQKN